MKKNLLWALFPLCLCRAQDTLSLRQAVDLALRSSRELAAAAAAGQAATDAIGVAKSATLPKVSYSESWTRSDNPVFVFSSLLTEHQFGAQNFQIGPLNRPDFLNNFQSLISADQTLYDGGRAKLSVRGAELRRDFAAQQGRQSEVNVIARVAGAYYDVLLAEAEVTAARQAMNSGEADLGRAESVRNAGLSTEADVLAIRVEVARVREELIRREADLNVALAELNDAIGLPLESSHVLSGVMTANASVAVPAATAGTIADRPELKQAQLGVTAAENRLAEARADRMPRVDLHTAFEADRQDFYNKGGANWLVSVGLKWNVFDGFAARGNIAAQTSALRERQAEAARTESGIRLQIIRAQAALTAATQRIDVTTASIAQAEETLRIIRNRYEGGLGNVTELIRAETAALEAKTRNLGALHDQRTAAIALALAEGSLSASSPVLNDSVADSTSNGGAAR